MRTIPSQSLERWISNLLRIGLGLAAAVVLAGGFFFLIGQAHAPADHHVFQELPAAYRTPKSIFTAAAHGDPLAVIQFGLLLLIATPIARVALSLGIFVMEGDRIYVVVTLIVLLILVGSVAGGY